MVTNYHSNIRYICIFRLKLLLFSQKTDPTERKYSSLPGNTTKIQSIKQSNTQQLVNCKSWRGEEGCREGGNHKHCHFQSCSLQLENGLNIQQKLKSEDSYSVTLLCQQALVDSGSIRMPRIASSVRG